MRALLLLLALPPVGPLLPGLLLALRRRHRTVGLGLALLLFWISGCEGLVAPLARRFAEPAPAAQTLAAAQAWRGATHGQVLVLGGGLSGGAAADGGYELKTDTLERLQRGVWWSRQLGLGLGFSGGVGHRAEPEQPPEAEVAIRVLKEVYGLTPAWVEAGSKDTGDNLRLSVPLLRQQGVRRVLLVTHALHMPRAMRHARALAPEIEWLPAPLTREPRPGWALADFLPSVEGLRESRYLVYELLATAAGR